MKKNVFYGCFVISLMILNTGCGVGKLAIKKRFDQKPKIAIAYLPSLIKKFPDYAQKENKWSMPMPKKYEKIAKDVVAKMMKKEWQNDKISYVKELGNSNSRDYDLIVYVKVYGSYRFTTPSKVFLKMGTSLSIFDPHQVKNLTSIIGEILGEVVSKSINDDNDDGGIGKYGIAEIVTKTIPPDSLLSALEKEVEKGLIKYIKDVKAAKE